MPKPQLRQTYRAIPQVLQKLRIDADFTQRDLAKRLKVAQNTIHRMEVGSRRCDAIEFIDWCRACGADPVEIFSELTSQHQSKIAHQ